MYVLGTLVKVNHYCVRSRYAGKS